MPLGQELVTNGGLESPITPPWSTSGSAGADPTPTPHTGSGNGLIGGALGVGAGTLSQALSGVGQFRFYRIIVALASLTSGSHPAVTVTLTASPSSTTVASIAVPANSLDLGHDYTIFYKTSSLTPAGTTGGTISITSGPFTTGQGILVDDVSVVEEG